MNCPTSDKLSNYVDELLTKKEKTTIENHLKNCESCSEVVNRFKEEESFIKETLKTPTLPDNFTASVLDQLEPYEPKAVKKKRKVLKPLMTAAAGVVLAIGLSTSLNESFAQWVGGFFSSGNVDEGIKIAADAGLAERVNLETTDQDLTLKVEDVMADSSRIALSYQILDENGKVQDTYFNFDDVNNKMTAVDQDGNEFERFGIAWSVGSDYGLIELSLREEEELEALTIKFDLTELHGKKGNWELDVPVDLKEISKYTTTVPLNDAETSEYGVALKMKKVQFAPSSSEIMYETSFTDEERTAVQEKIKAFKNQYGEDSISSLANYGTSLHYHLENEAGEELYHHNAFFEGKGHPSDSGVLHGSGQDLEEFGHTAWNDSFIPQKEEEKLTFVLDGVFKTVPSDFAITIKPDELKKEPLSFEYEGNYMTIKKADKEADYSLRKALMPIDREVFFEIEMEGGKEALASELGAWVITDNKGNVYEALMSGSILDDKDENDRYKRTIDLRAYDLEEVPEEFTLHLLSVTRYHEVTEKWRVPLYEGN
jgi:hypothetical protein